MPELLADLRPALRSLLRRPRFTLGVLLTLALGIGATTAIFSVINTVLIKPLPYREPASLALIWSRWSNFEKTWLADQEYFEYRRETRMFRDVALWDTGDDVSLTGDQGPEMVISVTATANLLGVLGIAPAFGRSFTAAEDVPGGPAVVLVGYDLWRRRFAGDPGLVGRTIQVDGLASTVVGILPKGFRLPLDFQSRTTAQLLAPMRLNPANVSQNHNYYSIARLQPGVTTDQVTAELRALTTRWTAEGKYPKDMQFSAYAVPLSQEVGGGMRTALLTLFAAVALLLLITCANVANLMLTRADSQSREMTVRAALGAGRHRLLRMTLTESLLLAVTGGAMGLLVALGGVRLIAAGAATSIPRTSELAVDGTVLGFTLALSLLTGLLFGAVPAFRLSQTNLIAGLKEGGRGGEGVGKRRGRALLVASEMALAVMLVIGAGLMVKSFRNLVNVDPGFDAGNALTLRLALPETGYPHTADLVRFYQELQSEVRRLPGVQAAGFVRALPLADDMGDAGMLIEGRPNTEGQAGFSADWQVVTPGYFEAQGMRLIKGRSFDQTDTPDGLQVIAINQTLADQYFPGEEPLGKRIQLGGPNTPWRTIVGVVADTRHHGLTGPIKREWFVPHNQLANSWGSTRRSMTLIARTTADPIGLLRPISRLVAAKDPNLPISRIATMNEILASAVREQRFTTGLMAGFALLALTLATIGVYAVISYSVSQRTREIGIRLALGADGGLVRRLVVRQGMSPALLGIGLGLASAAGLSRFLGSLLYGVKPIDPATFLLIPLCLLAVALGASLVPAHRATQVDPISALREE
jgi:putative ABC transport system permease protein